MAKAEMFKTSNSWFNRFKSHCNWHCIAGNREAPSIDEEARSLYPEKLKAMIEEGGYTSEIVLKMDETGQFW